MSTRWQFLKDEEGAWSMGRLGLATHSVFTWLCVSGDSMISWVSVPVSAYALLGTIFTGFLAWVAGPRIAKHLGPALGSFSIRGKGTVTDEGAGLRPPQNAVL